MSSTGPIWPPRSAPTGSSWRTPSTTAGRYSTGQRCCDARPGPGRRAGRRAGPRGTPDSLEIVYVVADYYEPYPKPCMHGWGRRHIIIAPDGRALPCPAAAQIAELGIDNVRDRSLEEIWQHSVAFTRFRGEQWMSEPCRGCPRRTIDFGGCRCQAFALTGDATRADPVCQLSPDRHLIDAALHSAGLSHSPLRRRSNPRVI
jgi:pyrroloquinoline quinone biosynthesis protein E